MTKRLYILQKRYVGRVFVVKTSGIFPLVFRIAEVSLDDGLFRFVVRRVRFGFLYHKMSFPVLCKELYLFFRIPMSRVRFGVRYRRMDSYAILHTPSDGLVRSYIETNVW